MITEHSSVASTLDNIIRKVETENENEKNRRVGTKRKHNEVHVANKRHKIAQNNSSGNEEIYCRICYDSSEQSPILYPCKCKGTMGAVHLKCLEHWLEESNRSACELCGYRFLVQRTPRYKPLHSVIVWLCLSQQQHQLYVRSFRTDLFKCLVITPMTIACIYVCIVGADYYAKNNFDNFPPARWTTYSLLAMIVVLIFSYFLWLYMAIQYHQKVWFYWWQKTSTVKIVLPQGNATPANSRKMVSQV